MGATWAFLNTVQSHAYCLINLGGIMTIIFCILACRKVKPLEKLGTAFIIIACILIVFDPKAIRVGQDFNPVNSALSILPSIPNALFFNYNDKLKKRIPLFQLLIQLMIYQTLISMILALLFNDAEFSIGDQGLFGFLAPKNAYLSLFYFSFMSGFWGLCGHTISLQYFSPVFVMNGLLLEPLIS